MGLAASVASISELGAHAEKLYVERRYWFVAFAYGGWGRRPIRVWSGSHGEEKGRKVFAIFREFSVIA